MIQAHSPSPVAASRVLEFNLGLGWSAGADCALRYSLSGVGIDTACQHAWAVSCHWAT